jgi:uncharacterized protein YeeX (DUF496 family)
MSEKDKEKRVDNIKKTSRDNSKYGVDLIKEIKNKFNEGMSINDVFDLYPQVKKTYLYTIKNNKRWVNI